ncbi:MAG: ABC transporter substrate-binding protein [Pseudomonadota bacterium]
MPARWLTWICLCVAFALCVPASGSVEVTSPLPFSGDIQLDAEQATSLDWRASKSAELRLIPPKNAPDLTCIKSRGVLVIGMINRDMPPFIMRDKDGNLSGIDVEIAREMARELGVKVAFNRSANTFDDVVEMVANRQADLGVSKISLTLLRAEKVRFTNPYVPLNKAILINRLALEEVRTNPEASLEDLLNRPSSQIGVEAGSSYVEYAKRIFPKATLVEFESWDRDIAPKVLNGELLAGFRDEWGVRETMFAAPQSYFENLSIVIKDETDPLMIITPWNSLQLLAWVNRFLEIKKINFSTDDLMKRYQEIKTTEKPKNSKGLK